MNAFSATHYSTTATSSSLSGNGSLFDLNFLLVWCLHITRHVITTANTQHKKITAITRISPVALSVVLGKAQLKSKAHMKHGSADGAGVLLLVILVVVTDMRHLTFFKFIYINTAKPNLTSIHIQRPI